MGVDLLCHRHWRLTAQSEVSMHDHSVLQHYNDTTCHAHIIQALKLVRRVLRSATWTRFVVFMRKGIALSATAHLDTAGRSASVSI